MTNEELIEKLKAAQVVPPVVTIVTNWQGKNSSDTGIVGGLYEPEEGEPEWQIDLQRYDGETSMPLNIDSGYVIQVLINGKVIYEACTLEQAQKVKEKLEVDIGDKPWVHSISVVKSEGVHSVKLSISSREDAKDDFPGLREKFSSLHVNKVPIVVDQTNPK